MIPNDPSHLPKTFSANICKMVVWKLKLLLSSSQASMSSLWTYSMSTSWTSDWRLIFTVTFQPCWGWLVVWLKKPKICPDGHQCLYWSACCMLWCVCVFPNKDQLRSEAADVGGIWRMMEATGERASDPQSPFYQVADEICWHDCHIASPSQSLCLEVYFARLPRTLPSSRPRWQDTVVMAP